MATVPSRPVVPLRRSEPLPFHRPIIGPEEEREVLATLRSGWLTAGPRTRLFEKQFADFIGVKHAIGLNSCTAGLHLALQALKVGPGDEVITSPITFAATANMIVHVGARPVFADVEPETLNIDAEQIERAVTVRTKAILPVHFAGQPCDMDAIGDLAARRHLAVLADCAHAVEAEWAGRRIGSYADCAAYSFYATKNITTGEGGMVTTDDDALAERMRLLSLHGISRDAWQRHGDDGYQHWDTLAPGFKYNMFDLQAALGMHQLPRADAWCRRRRSLANRYDRAFRAIPEVEPLGMRRPVGHARHLYVIVVKVEHLRADRDTVLRALEQAGIGVGVHFRPIHLHPYYRRRFGFRPGSCPAAEYAGDRIISLPLYPRMTDQDADDVIAAVADVISRFRPRS